MEITDDITAESTGGYASERKRARTHAGEREREKERKRARVRTRERDTHTLRYLSAHLDMPTDDITAKSIGGYACV